MIDWADFLSGAITPEKNPFVRQDRAVPIIVINELKRRKTV